MLSSLFTTICGHCLYLAVILINRTLRLTTQNHSEHPLFDNTPFIFAIWHHNTFTPFYIYRHRNIAMFVANDLKGNILGIAARKLGYDTLPLERDGLRSTIRMLNKIKSGQNSLMAVDGPNGPRKVIKNGVQHLTKKANTPTLAVSVTFHCALSLFWRWDCYKIPLPFSRVTIIFSKPYLPSEQWAHLPHDLDATP